MAGRSAPIRKALALALLTAAAATARATATAAPPKLVNPHGTTKGLVTTSPQWSAGVRVGNFGATGIDVQKTAFAGNALELGLGLAHNSATLSVDYLVILGEDWSRKPLTGAAGYNDFRGELNPFVGGGLQVGRGVSLRLPVGLQYTMLRDPFNFFGGVALLVGRFFADDDVGAEAWFMIGARALL